MGADHLIAENPGKQIGPVESDTLGPKARNAKILPGTFQEERADFAQHCLDAINPRIDN